MANLLSNTTVGGSAVITTSNIGSYALTSLPSHNHDDRYFTETESDGRFQPLENQRVSTSSTVRFSNTYTTAWFRNDNSNTGLYNESTTMHWSSNQNGFWDVSSTNSESSIRFYTGGHKSALRGYLYANSSDYIGFLNNGGNWSLRTDSARNTTLFGNLTVGQDAANSSIFMSDSDEGMREIHCNSNRIGFLTQGGSWGAYADDSANWFATGYIQSFNSMYSPTYYDGNNSSYYMDLDGISNIWRLQVNGKYTYFGGSDNWDTGNLNGVNNNITNVHFQGHVDFWIGAGNTKWYTSVASGHHDLLINTMQSGGGNTRGITFTASTNGGSVYRLGRWFSHSTQAGSYLNVDGSIKIGGTSDTYFTPTAKLHVVGATAGTDVVAVDGVYGRLFTVTDDLSDSLFSVNTIAGLPVIEAFADNTVKIGKYGSNSITISGSKIAINSDTVDANFPFYVGDRSTAGSRYSLTNKGMGFNLADNYAQLQLFGGAGAYIDFVTSTGEDSGGRIMWNGSNFVVGGSMYFNNASYTYTLYDRNDTNYYLDMNGTSRLGTLNINQLSVYGNTYLGDGNGDEVHINDILRVGATDSGDAHFYFGEGSQAGSDYGLHWYWDSAYTFTWNTRNAGTDTALFDYLTNDTTYVNWRRNFHMQDRAINYTGQLHFSYGTRFEANSSNYLNFKTDSTSYGGIQVRDGNSTTRGYSGYFDSNGFGLLNSGGTWGIRLNPGSAETLLYYAGDWRIRTGSGGAGINGNLYTDTSYGYGLVGLYSAERYQGVFAMGDSYKLPADGTSTGSLYGIAWTHTNIGGQSKPGLSHQALFVTNGITQTAIGTGIWTSGLITTTSYGTSANWKAAYDWGNHASAGYLTSVTNISGNAGTVTHNASRTDSTFYNVGWFSGNPSPAYSCDAVQIQSSTGTLKSNNLVSNQVVVIYGNIADTTNGSTWYGLGNAGNLLGGGNTVQLAGYFGVRIKTSGASMDFSGSSAYYSATFNSAILQQAGNQVLHAGNYTSYSPSLTGSGASGTWGINVTGSAGSVAWTNVSSRPTALSQFTNDLGNYGGWITSSGSISGNAATATSATYLNSSNYIIQRGSNGSWNNDFTSTPAGTMSYAGDLGANTTNGPGGTWWIQQNFRHTNSSSYWGTQVAWGWEDNANRLATRNIQGGSFGSWVYYLNSSNFTSYAPSLTGSGASGTWGINVTGSASTAGSATMASQLSKYGDIYGDNWNTYYVSGKFIASAVLGMTGPNKPPTSYDYGVALSYGETGGPLMQWYFPENSSNGTTIFKKGVYRTGWNGNWSSWKTLVEQEGDLCTIVGGAGTGLEVHGNVGYNQNPLTYFLLRGQADTSWKSFKVRLTGDAGGQDIEFRRIAENGADERMFWVPRVANQVIFDYFFVQASDERKKDNITIISNPIEKVKQLRGAEFDWNSGVNEGTHDVGLIAQDVEAVLPEAVTTQEDGYKNLAYNKVIPLLVEAMKEQQTMIEALKAEIELLKNR
jgi:hypothetical protein